MAPGRGSQLGAAGLCLSCVATVLLAVSAATESWLRLWVLGIVIHRGLWRECQLGACAPLHGQRGYVEVSRGCLALAVLAGYLSVLCGALALTPCLAPWGLDWAQGAAGLCFLTGALAGVALACFMGGSAGEAGGSWAWSLAVGWAAVPAAGLAARNGAAGAMLRSDWPLGSGPPNDHGDWFRERGFPFREWSEV
ncbi:claudin domain-containing protein 2-like [Emydura macquarii macquarii]|uniref:claudin domain-containing protein 2-like n=1 Tax=Emydura macquarii macquarii TaxID=1129001 RepID=UPI00352B8DAF